MRLRRRRSGNLGVERRSVTIDWARAGEMQTESPLRPPSDPTAYVALGSLFARPRFVGEDVVKAWCVDGTGFAALAMQRVPEWGGEPLYEEGQR